MKIGLVGCVKDKLEVPAPAQDLYISDYFRKGRAYVEQAYDGWFILSAKYGLVLPNVMIAPYDYTLKGQRVAVKRAWSQRVAAQIREAGLLDHDLYFHAGEDYVKYLIPLLAGASIHRPLQGLGIGSQKRWYLDRLR